MIIRISILGILSIIVLILIWNFYDGVIDYNPIKEVEFGRENKAKGEGKEILIPPVWGKEIVEKNLFSQRRGVLPPPPPPVIIVPKAEPPKPQRPVLALKGIVLDSSGEYIAFIEKTGSKPIALRKGDEIEGAVVIDVSARSVKLLWNDEEINLSMEKIRTLKR